MATVDDQRIVEFDVRTDEMLVNMGPQHPSTHGVLRLVLRTDGEIVSEVTPHLGLPSPLRGEDWREPHAAAVDSVYGPYGLPGRDEHESWLGFVRRENPRTSTFPKRQSHLRVIISLSLGRIASHLVGMGGVRVGPRHLQSRSSTRFVSARKILDLFEEACGARLDLQLP